MTVLEDSSHRGVGWTQVVNPPFVSRYLRFPELFKGLTPEVRLRLQGAEHAPVNLIADEGGPERVVERSGARPGVELEAVGCDSVAPRREHDVAARDQLVGVDEQISLVGVQFPVSAIDLDLVDEPDVVHIDLLDSELEGVTAWEGLRFAGLRHEDAT